MSQENQNEMFAGDEGTESIDDTTYRKIFVGGLAWRTENETMKSYFQQFGEIHEAVVINDKRTGKSKGYGFVTFKDADSATKACQDPNPVIDGRRANCNLAYIGANKNRAVNIDHHQQGMEKASPTPRLMPQSIQSHQYMPQYSHPYAYGYPRYPQDMYTMQNYYNAYGGQQFPPYYTSVASGSPGVYYYNCYPYYAQHGQNNPTQNSKMIKYPYFPQQHSSHGMPWLPTSSSPSTSTAGPPTTPPTAGGASNVKDDRPTA